MYMDDKSIDKTWTILAEDNFIMLGPALKPVYLSVY
jgi:hypothetical protein